MFYSPNIIARLNPNDVILQRIVLPVVTNVSMALVQLNGPPASVKELIKETVANFLPGLTFRKEENQTENLYALEKKQRESLSFMYTVY